MAARLWLAMGLLFLIGVSVLSLIPVSGTGVNDKLSHVLTYLFLALWFSFLVSERGRLIGLVLGLLFFGALIELLQSLTSYRTAEWADLAANLSGIAIAMPFYLLPLHRLLRQKLAT